MPDDAGRPISEPQAAAALWTARLLPVGWWLVIFTLTHVPIPAALEETPVSDKWIHVLLYGLLGFLLPYWDGWWTPLTWRRGLTLFALLAVYAVIDELLQIPVGRTADWLDGRADLIGGAAGLTAAAIVRALRHRLQVARGAQR